MGNIAPQILFSSFFAKLPDFYQIIISILLSAQLSRNKFSDFAFRRRCRLAPT